MDGDGGVVKHPMKEDMVGDQMSSDQEVVGTSDLHCGHEGEARGQGESGVSDPVGSSVTHMARATVVMLEVAMEATEEELDDELAEADPCAGPCGTVSDAGHH